MSIAKGLSSISKLYLGSTEVSKAYLGSDLVFGTETPPNYLCFTAIDEGTFTATLGTDLGTSYYESISYSVDGGETWVTTANADSTEVTVTTPSISAGDSVLWKGTGTKTQTAATTTSNHLYFTSTGSFNASGNPLSLLFSNFSNITTSSTSFLLGGIFYECTTLNSAVDMEMPLTSCGTRCWNDTFYGCTNMLYAPSVCSVISSGSYSFNRTFMGCTKLKTAPDLSALRLQSSTYSFARTFQNCTSLESEIVLNIETVAKLGFPTTFYGCKKLNYIKAMFLTIGSSGLSNWVNGVASSGIFVKHIDATWTTTGASGVPSGWTIIYYDPDDGKYYTDQTKATECDKYGNTI